MNTMKWIVGTLAAVTLVGCQVELKCGTLTCTNNPSKSYQECVDKDAQGQVVRSHSTFGDRTCDCDITISTDASYIYPDGATGTSCDECSALLDDYCAVK